MTGPLAACESLTVKVSWLVPLSPSVIEASSMEMVGTTGGGVFKTLDGGQSWARVTDRYFGGTIGAVAVSASNPDVVYVGGAVWDVIACARAGVPAIGLLSGGVSREELEKAGAKAVFHNPQDLCDHLDETPIGALSR